MVQFAAGNRKHKKELDSLVTEIPISLNLENCDGFANAVQKALDLRGKMEPELVDAVVSRFIEAAIANPPTITAQLGDNINSHLSPHAEAVYMFVAAHKSVNAGDMNKATAIIALAAASRARSTEELAVQTRIGTCGMAGVDGLITNEQLTAVEKARHKCDGLQATLAADPVSSKILDQFMRRVQDRIVYPAADSIELTSRCHAMIANLRG